jgi:hypothetical protein
MRVDKAYTTAAKAVARSISHDEVAHLAAEESLHISDALKSALESLEAFGIEGHDDADDLQRINAWGTHEGNEWQVRIVYGTVVEIGTYVR